MPRMPIILVVEDNPDDEVMTLEALQSSGLGDAVVVAHNGEEALDYLFQTGAYRGQDVETPSVVLLDLKLPKVDGLEVLARIRADQRLQALPVAILTSSDEEQDLVEGYRLAVGCYIRKPVELNELAEAFRQLGIYWMTNQPGMGSEVD